MGNGNSPLTIITNNTRLTFKKIHVMLLPHLTFQFTICPYSEICWLLFAGPSQLFLNINMDFLWKVDEEGYEDNPRRVTICYKLDIYFLKLYIGLGFAGIYKMLLFLLSLKTF